MDPLATTAYIALGANLGDRLGALRAAVQGLSEHPAITVGAVSAVYETAAHTLSESEEQPPYLNAVVEICTRLGPSALLAVLHALEARAGRQRRRRWAPRHLDLDLLLYGQITLGEPGLVVPHPRLAERRFVLQPLADLAPNLHVPAPFDSTVAALLARCPDTDRPRRLPDPLQS